MFLIIFLSIVCLGCPLIQGKLCQISFVGLHPSACFVVVVAFHLISKVGCYIMCVLYVENVFGGGMDVARHRDLLNNTLNILSSFILLWTEPLLDIAK